MAVLQAVTHASQLCVSKVQQGITATEQSLTLLLDQAHEIDADRAELGEDVTRRLLDKSIANTRKLLAVEAQQKGHKRTLERLPQDLPADAKPADLRRRFQESLQTHTAAQTNDDHPALKKLRALVDGEASGGAGSSGNPEEDEVVMTQQQQTSFRCPVSFKEMTSTGALRPMMPKPNSGHTAKCFFSHEGIMSHIKQQKGRACACPTHGCDAKITQADLVEAKEVARQIRDKEREESEE